jgi:hypothetical protein
MKKLFLPFVFLFSLLLTSCSDKVMGYSVVLWTIPEQQIKSGDIVPVYIKSNISHVYVIGTESGEKIEVALWQLTDPVKKGKVKNVAAKYADNAATYASVKLDGLPCRAEPVNTAKQVYRLRKGEVIKILYKGNGQAPMAGKTALEGDWYRILTDDGTMGWCFSYNLNLYETDAAGQRIGGAEIVVEEEADDRWNVITSNTWYPDYFRTMIDGGNIDLSLIHPLYKFTIDEEGKKVSLNTSEIHESWDYDGFTKTDENEYSLNGISMKIIYRRSNYIVLRYTDSSGKPQDLNFVTLSESVADIVNAEKTRRTQAYMQIWSHGPIFSSSSYGKISFNEDGTFRWTGFKLLVPSVIDAGTKNTGSASVKYSLSKDLAASYDGVLTMKFDGMSREVNFLYKLEDGALRLEDTTGASFSGSQLKSRGVSPVIVYMKK